MLALHSLYEIDPESLKHLKQAAIWGTGSLMGARLTQDKKHQLTKEEQDKNKKKTTIQGLVGAAAGFAGSKFS